MTYSLTAAVFFSSILCMGGTELVSDGKTLFKASGNVTFGATYTDRAVKATVSTVAPVSVTIHTNRKPTHVFIGMERLAPSKWSYDADSGHVTLQVPGGSTDLQLRFDDLTSLKPFETTIPVILVREKRPDVSLGDMTVTVAGEKGSGTFEWTGREGFYRVKALRDGREAEHAGLSVQGGTEDGQALLQKGTVLRLNAEAPGQELHVDRVVCQLVSGITQTVRVPKDELDWENSLLVEGEDFSAEGGGAVKKSTEHQNTHGGACIFTWANPGHWIEWNVPVAQSGRYMLTIIIASQEETVLRSIDVDGQPVDEAAVLDFEGTGGWGRVDPNEWQPCRPVDEEGRPVLLQLASGTHRVRMTNLLGQHMNVDCILLTPIQ